MPNQKVVMSSLTLSLFVFPSLLGFEIASASTYTKPKTIKSSPVLKISGALNLATRYVDGGYGNEVQITSGDIRHYGDKVSNANVLVGQSYNNEGYSHLQATAQGSTNNFKLTGIIRLASRTNAFERYTQDNEWQVSLFNSDNNTTNGVDEDFYLNIADIQLLHKTLGKLNIGKASTATSESTKATFSQTGYIRGDIFDSYNVRIGADTGNAEKSENDDWEFIGMEFGTYGLNHSQNRIQYTAPEFVKGLSLSYEYVSQSDVNEIGPGLNAPKYDSNGFAASYKTSMSGIDVEGRWGYTSRALEPFYKGGSVSATKGGFHLRGTGASAAIKCKGFDASYAYAQLNPKNFINRDNENDLADTTVVTDFFGEKSAKMHAYELGYSIDLPHIGTVHFNGEMAESKHYRNDGSKARLKGLRIAHDLGPVKVFGKFHQYEFSGFNVYRFESNAARTFFKATGSIEAQKAPPKDVKTYVIGAYYKF